MNYWRLSRQVWELKTSGAHHTFVCLTRSSARYSQWTLEISPPVSGEGKTAILNTPEHSVLNKACLQDKLFYQNLANLGEGQYPSPAPSSPVPPKRGGGGSGESWKRWGTEGHSPGRQAHYGWDLTKRWQSASPPCTHLPSYVFLRANLPEFLPTNTSCSAFNKNITRHAKRRKSSLKTQNKHQSQTKI